MQSGCQEAVTHMKYDYELICRETSSDKRRSKAGFKKSLRGHALFSFISSSFIEKLLIIKSLFYCSIKTAYMKMINTWSLYDLLDSGTYDLITVFPAQFWEMTCAVPSCSPPFSCHSAWCIFQQISNSLQQWWPNFLTESFILSWMKEERLLTAENHFKLLIHAHAFC